MRRRLLKENNNFKRVRYIESSGQQIINTGYKLYTRAASGDYADVDFDIYIEFYTKKDANKSTPYVCIINSMKEVSTYPGFALRKTSNTYSEYMERKNLDNGAWTDSSTQNYSDSVMYSGLLSMHLYRKSTNKDTVHDTPVTIFGGLDGNGNPWRFSSIILYTCKIYDHQTLVRDFVPIDVNGTGALYDNVTGQIFYDLLGNGFVCGPQIEENWNYLHINTGNSFNLYGANSDVDKENGQFYVLSKMYKNLNKVPMYVKDFALSYYSNTVGYSYRQSVYIPPRAVLLEFENGDEIWAQSLINDGLMSFEQTSRTLSPYTYIYNNFYVLSDTLPAIVKIKFYHDTVNNSNYKFTYYATSGDELLKIS